MFNQLFDNIYCLNLAARPERMDVMNRRFQFLGMECERFKGINGNILKYFHRQAPAYFTNPNYVGCNLSHIAIYQDALDRGFKHIMVIEDDVRINRYSNRILGEAHTVFNYNWDLLYFAYIPLSDDLSRWDYGVLPIQPGSRLFTATNMWSLMAYGISEKLMRHMVEVYSESFPMEIDRYYVNHIQKSPDFKCLGISPQLVCAEDGPSDNSGRNEIQMMERSVDRRFAQFIDYV